MKTSRRGVNHINEETLIKNIKSELERRRRYFEQISPIDLIKTIDKGEIPSVIHGLLFYASPRKFLELMNGIREKATANRNIMMFLTEITIDIQSFLPKWNLRNSIFHKDILDDETIGKEVIQNYNLIEAYSKSNTNLRDGIIAYLRIQEGLRLRAEGMADDELSKEVDRLVGNSLSGYIYNAVETMKQSNLPSLVVPEDSTDHTELGNDYAQFLWHAMRLGVSFVTTNPVLVKLAWDNTPEVWNNRVIMMLKEHLLSRTDSDKVAILVTEGLTREIVLENAMLLRGIFLLSEGRYGYVNLQVNPENHNDTEAMVMEARRHYEHLEIIFGGVPNVVFKLPGTMAGLKAAELLTKDGIGVTITINFSLFQSQSFAEIINKGHALVSYLVIMNGRLAYPVRDELVARNINGGLEAAQWSAVAVTKKLHRYLYTSKSDKGLGLDPKKVRILVASLRNYEDFFPDISETFGVPAITIFPDIRRQFDSKKRNISPGAISESMQDSYLEILANSETFKQAYHLPDDGDKFRPLRPLTLEQEEAVLSWIPVKNTLEQFRHSYNQTTCRIKSMILGTSDTQKCRSLQ